MIRVKRVNRSRSTSLFNLAGLVTLFFTYVGCASTLHIENQIKPPELIQKTVLPPLPSNVKEELQLRLRLLIDEQGTVVNVQLENPTGNRRWDSLTTESIRQWRYTPATANGRPIKIWIYQTAKVITETPHPIPLWEIVCRTKETADSIINALKKGARFDSLATIYSLDPSRNNGGFIGLLDIYQLPQSAWPFLLELGENTFTPPIKLGVFYVIYWRAELKMR